MHESRTFEDLGREMHLTPAGRISVTVPPGWTWSETVALVSADEGVKIEVDAEALAEDVTVEEIAERTGDSLRSNFDDFEELRLEKVVLLGAATSLVREFRCTLEGGQKVRAMQLYSIVGGHRLRASATVAEELAASSRDDILAILLSLSISRD